MHQIGSGVLGPVYRARLSDRDDSGERLFALKAFHVDLTPEQTIVFGDALQELVDLELSHPALVSPVGAGVADGVPYLAYEYIAGESLDVRMRPRASLAVEAAMPIVVRLAEALDAAQRRTAMLSRRYRASCSRGAGPAAAGWPVTSSGPSRVGPPGA